MTQEKINRKLKKTIDELSAINQIIREIALNVSKPDFMEFVYEKIYAIIKPELSLIYLIKNGRLKLQGDPLKSSSIKPEIRQHHHIGECLCGMVAETGKAIYTEDILSDTRCTLEECKKAGIRSFAALPLEIQGRIRGVLGIASTSRRRFCDHSDFLESLGGHIAIGISSAGLYEEIQQKNNLLEAELIKHKQTELALRESEENYRHLVKYAPTGIYEVDAVNLRFKSVNDAMCQFLGYTKDELLSMNPLDILSEESKKNQLERMRKIDTGQKVSETSEKKVKAKNGREYWALLNSRFKYDKGKLTSATVVVHDITDRKLSEEALKKAHNDLERKVAERTFELAEANQQLKVKADNLKEANITLNVLLRKREDDKKELEEKILLNVKELVTPYLKKLKKSGLDERQKTLADILESNLSGIISPFLHTLSTKYSNLTPKEIRVAGLVREGKTTKEIAKLLISSTDTIDFHRKNIRKKLGLKNTNSNLRSYLLSLT